MEVGFLIDPPMMGRSFSLEFLLLFWERSELVFVGTFSFSWILLSNSRCSLILSSVMWSARVPEFLFTVEEEEEEEGHNWGRVKLWSSVFLFLLRESEELDPVLRRSGEWELEWLSPGDKDETYSVEVVVEVGVEGRNRELTSRFLCWRGFGDWEETGEPGCAFIRGKDRGKCCCM